MHKTPFLVPIPKPMIDVYECIVPVVLAIVPSVHGIQSKQQVGFPFISAFLVPTGQTVEHTDFGT